MLAGTGGVALDVGLRGGPANAAVVAGLALTVAALVVHGVARRAEPRALALAALVPAAFLAVRASPWLAASNQAVSAALLAGAVLLSRSGTLADTTPVRLLGRAAGLIGAAAAAADAVRARRARCRGLARMHSATGGGAGHVDIGVGAGAGGGDARAGGVAAARAEAAEGAVRVLAAATVTVPLLLVVLLLLAAADPVFAGLLRPDVALGPVAGHVALTAVLAAGIVVVVAAARVRTHDGTPAEAFGTTEVAAMLAPAAALMGLFAASQAVAATGAGERLVESAGLTPAEYARSGFFQLSAAAALIVAYLGVVRGLARPEVMERPAIRLLAGAVPLLALGLVGVSLRRMALYDDAFGLTMLRLWVVGAAVWMGVVLVMVAARNLGLGARRDWVLGGSLAAALVLVVAADVADPEAFVVRHNVDRAAAGADLDADYLHTLSHDAVPARVAAWADAPAALRSRLGEPVRCAAAPGTTAGRDVGAGREARADTDATGVAALNLAAARAADARAAACPPGGEP